MGGRVQDTVEIDLSEVLKSAELVRQLLTALRTKYDLAAYEYTKQIRVAPCEVPHSHPILTLNTMIRSEAPLLSIYLHEQMHWYVTWYSYSNPTGWQSVWQSLKKLFPNVPVVFPQGAHTEASSYLHIIINWLQVESTASVLGREVAVSIAEKNFVYSGIYTLVLGEWDRLDSLYREHGLMPIKSAAQMTFDDLLLAARSEEAQVC